MAFTDEFKPEMPGALNTPSRCLRRALCTDLPIQRGPTRASGAKAKSNAMTMNFSKARDKAEIDWGNGTPATFHEQRSLSERLYEAQGVDTQKLLGHKSQKQTDQYHDDRGKDWITVAI